jgi:hypothetical protein
MATACQEEIEPFLCLLRKALTLFQKLQALMGQGKNRYEFYKLQNVPGCH